MKKVVQLMLISSMIMLPVCLLAQARLSMIGSVLDKNKRPVSAATVNLLQAKDSVLSKVALTGEDGTFQLENIKPGTYRLSVTAVGFAGYLSDSMVITAANPVIRIPAIEIAQAEASQLNAVTVTARKPFVERKIDRTVVNVDALISNAGTNALEVLDKSPGILVDQDGNISMNGKPGVVIFIDDKPTYLSGAELAAYLKSLPSGTLETIEIMTRPPARYDAAGNAGVINIKTKKLKQKGFNGNISPGYTQGVYPKSNNSLNLNFRNNAFNYYLNMGYNYNEGFNDLDIERRYVNDDGTPHSLFSQNSWIRRNSSSGSLRTGVDYTIDKFNSIGLMLSGSKTGNRGTVNNKSYLYNGQGALDSLITADNVDNRDYSRGSATLNFRHKFKQTGRELSADLDYIYNESHADQYYRNASYKADQTVKGRDDLSGIIPSYINIYSFKSDYTQPLAGGVKAEAGIKGSLIETNNIATYNVIINNVTYPDYDKTNHFTYRENINAGYVNFSKDWKRVSLQAGLRAENTIMRGHQLGNAQKPDSSFKRDYVNLFPTFYMSYKLDSASVNQFILSYGKRIQRPNFGNLNPFISPLDKFTFYVGNPFLQPTIAHSVELSHVYKNKITTSLSYEYYDGDINETIELQGHQYYSRPANVGTAEYLSLSVNASFEPASWVTVNWFGLAQYVTFKANLYNNKLDTSGYNVITNFNSQFRLGKGWTAEVLGLFRGDIITTQFVLGDFWTLGGGISKKILKGKGTIKLTLNDLFYTRLNYGLINNLKNAKGRYYNQGDTRLLGINFTWNFGKTFETRKRSNGSAESETQRI
ncbi:outer membrane beta-barrel protein [Paraflavitalea sp. CAU 1676]|uniref:outer membrane beta-barrel protein n=1 Tax=Paraflavitalea sp. CAU 1676 TaxID=3032598 RepID=UPI0023DB8D2A|nr:outer membrane beta-barrel protein [Paraflavitalea sp. CAU 1676]MDF2189594.1 TonB-dependent receptor [Paraflavitalea sp. CAU 1676]